MIKRILSSVVIGVLSLFLFNSFNVKALSPLVVSIEGASIRTSESEEVKQGLRFYAKLDESVKDNVHGFYIAYGYATVDDLEDALLDDPVIINGKNVFRQVVNGVNLENEYSIVLTGIPGIGYFDEISVIPFVVYNEEEVFYNSVTRSIAEVAFKALSLGDSVGSDVVNYVSNNFKRTSMTLGGEIELVSGVYEFTPFILVDQFIDDWNEMFQDDRIMAMNPLEFFNSAKVGLDDDITTNKDLSNSNLYKFFNHDYYGDRWGWLLNYIAIEGFSITDLARQRVAISGNGTNNDFNLYHGANLVYSIVNFFNLGNEQDDYPAVNFSAFARYDRLKSSNNKVFINPNYYDFFHIGTHIPIDDGPEVHGHELTHIKIGDVLYPIGSSYEVTIDDVIIEFIYEIANYEVLFYYEDELIEELTLTYTYLDEIMLPEMDIDGIIFESWHSTPDLYNFDVHEIIEEDSTGDKIFYANAYESDYRRMNVTFNLNGGNVLDYGEYIMQLNPAHVVTQIYTDIGKEYEIIVSHNPLGIYYETMGFRYTNAEGIYILEAYGYGLHSEHDIYISYHYALPQPYASVIKPLYWSLDGPIVAYIPNLPEEEPSLYTPFDIYFLTLEDFYGELTLRLVEPSDMPIEVIKDGYEFAGWYLDEELTEGPVLVYPGYDWDHQEKDLTYYAKWNVAQYNLTFDSGYEGAPIVDPQTRNYGQLWMEPNEPEREGYIFIGWYYNDEWFDFDVPITKSVDLVAKWIEEV